MPSQSGGVIYKSRNFMKLLGDAEKVVYFEIYKSRNFLKLLGMAGYRFKIEEKALLVNAVNHIGIMPYIVHISQGNDR